jgi:hypothetical protein
MNQPEPPQNRISTDTTRCSDCGKIVSKAALKAHQQSAHPRPERGRFLACPHFVCRSPPALSTSTFLCDLCTTVGSIHATSRGFCGEEKYWRAIDAAPDWKRQKDRGKNIRTRHFSAPIFLPPFLSSSLWLRRQPRCVLCG